MINRYSSRKEKLDESFLNKKLKEAKELCYREAVRKQNAIIKALKNESDADKERIDYLNSLNTLLQSAIKDLEYDLGMSY